MTDKLKPCPFCGSNKVGMATGDIFWVDEKYQGNIRVVGCANCGVFGGVFNTLALSDKVAKKRAIKSWNRRVKNDR